MSTANARTSHRAEASMECRIVCPSRDKPHPPSYIDAVETIDVLPATNKHLQFAVLVVEN